MKLINNLPQKLGIQKQVDTLAQSISALQTEFDTLAQSISALQTELDNIKTQLDALTQEPPEQPAEPETP